MLMPLTRFAGLDPNHAGIPEQEESNDGGDPQKNKDRNTCRGATC